MDERGTFEREMREVQGWQFDRQVPPAGQVERVGQYEVRGAAGAVRFWRVQPGAQVPTGAGYVLFDVLIELSSDPVTVTQIAPPQLPAQVTGAAPDRRGDLVRNGTTIPIAFAVAPNAGNDFRGTLRLTIARPGNAKVIDLSIAGAAGTRVADLWVYAVPHTNLRQAYGFTRLRVVQAANTAIAVAAASVTVQVVRDNEQLADRRRMASPFTTDANGYAERMGRTLLALPTRWPVIVRASATNHVARSHFVRLANASDNLAPTLPPDLPLRRRADVAIANRRILFDPGHGVVYNHEQRRSQEWFAAHKLVDEVIRQLTTFFRVPRQNIVLTRTAGFGLIEPANVNAAATNGPNNTPVFSDRFFTFDLPNRRIRIAAPAGTAVRRNLRQLSDLLLVTHAGDANTAQPVPVADRTRLLTTNAATLAAIEQRLNTSLGPARRVRPGSMRWDTAADNYVYTREPAPGQAGSATDVPLPITTADWFTLDDAMFHVLADRSARWSLRREIGSGPGAAGTRPAFATAARDTMRAEGAIDYMRGKILDSISPGVPAEYLANDIKGWGPTLRRNFINTLHGNAARRCDLYLTVHLNAFSTVNPKGFALLLDDATTNADQIRLAKIFLKHVDPLSHGLKNGGIVRNNAGMLDASNNAQSTYAYFETEFMTSVTAADPNRYNFADMVRDPYVSNTAERMVEAIIEALENPQSDLDSITLRGNFATGATTHW